MPESISDLLKSKATIWVAPAGEALPDETTVDVGDAWGGNWVKVGWTTEGVKALYEWEDAELVADQILGPLARRKINEAFTIETILAEVTALNLAYASGMASGDVTTTAAGASQDGYEQLSVGDEPVPDVWAVGIEGINYQASDGPHPVRIFLYRATLHINGELEFTQRSDAQTGIPFQAKALADTGNSNAMFVWQRVTDLKTS